jgi:pentapeptide repeat protein
MPPSQVAPSNKPPEFAKKADDLEVIKKTVDDAASVSGGLWLSYLFVLFYLAVAAGAVTHADLFFQHAVKLPFLGIELPLVAFFFLAPILFVIAHAYTLVHLVMLTDKTKRYHQALYEQIKGQTERRKATRDKLRRQLPSNIFIQFLAGPSDLRNGAFGRLLRAIAWISLVIAPALLLMMIQIQFLPYHSMFVTWTQRIALLFDLALVWWLWRRVLSGGERDSTAPLVAHGRVGAPARRASLQTAAQAPVPTERRPPLTGTMASLVAIWIWPLFNLIVVAFSCAIATFPGEWQEARHWDRPMWAVNALFNDPDDLAVHRFPFSNTLVLESLNVYESLGINDPDKAEWRDVLFHAAKRDLRGAIFVHPSLPRVDFTQADFRGARLNVANLQGAKLDDANLQGASLVSAHLQGASLDSAQLQGASLVSAYLQGASLDSAQLQGASLVSAQLQGASLASAQLQGVSFSSANLEATDLRGAYLWRSNQEGAPASLSAVRMLEDDKSWQPRWLSSEDQAWNENAYEDLRKSLQSLPSGSLQDKALERVKILDPAAPLPPEATGWRDAVTKATVAAVDYPGALVKSLKALFCSGDENAIFLVRPGAGLKVEDLAVVGRLRQAGAGAPGLIAELLSKDSSSCPLAASLTDADRATLLRIKQEITPVAYASPVTK